MIVLASQSPRRSEILRQAGIPFVARPANVDETARPGESPEDYVKRVACDKAMAAVARRKAIISTQPLESEKVVQRQNRGVQRAARREL